MYFKGLEKVPKEMAQECPLENFKKPSALTLFHGRYMQFGTHEELPKTYQKALKRHGPKHTGNLSFWFECVILTPILMFTTSAFDQTLLWILNWSGWPSGMGNQKL